MLHDNNMTSSDSTSRQTLRIIDANLNRIGEGLRLLEEIARLLLNDTTLTQQLKNMRHELLRGDWSFQQRLLSSRDSEEDVGVNLEVPGEEEQRELPTTVVANARRVQESLRTLEELAKIPGISSELDSEQFKQARFSLYTIEQNLLARLMRQDKTKRLCGLYVIIDTEALKGRSHIGVAAEVIRGGAKIIQLRDKTMDKKELLSIAQELGNLCAEQNVLFIMNDDLDIALAARADGLHVGQRDLPVRVARKLLSMDMILGCSVTTVEQAVSAEADGADHIAVGSIYPTPTKETAKAVGLEMLRQVRQETTLPLVAIGGITRDSIAELRAAGADSVAVISAVLGANSPEEAAREIVDRFEIQE